MGQDFLAAFGDAVFDGVCVFLAGRGLAALPGGEVLLVDDGLEFLGTEEAQADAEE